MTIKKKTKCLKISVGIFRVVIFWMGIIQREFIMAKFDGWEFSGSEFLGRGKRLFWYPFRFVYKTLRLFVFIPKTLSFHCKYKVILGCSVSRSLLYSVSFFKYLLLKSRFHLLFRSSFKKLLWENNHLEVLCRIIVIPKWAISLKKLFKRVWELFSKKKNWKNSFIFWQENNCFSR